jgi:hypothetical protein
LILVSEKRKYFCERGWTSKITGGSLICPSCYFVAGGGACVVGQISASRIIADSFEEHIRQYAIDAFDRPDKVKIPLGRVAAHQIVWG